MRDSACRNASCRQELQSLANRNRFALNVLDLDVTSDASVDEAVREALDRAGRIDVVLNNAGVGAVGVTEAFTAEEFQRLLDVNLLGAVRVNRAVLPAMRRQRSGLLIHVSSGAGRYVIPCMAAYCASKFALEALADTYRFELTPFGIDSVVIEPGVHRTPIFGKFAVPADRERVVDYGSAAEYAERVRARFDASVATLETPGPEALVEALIRIVEIPAGRRPFRTVLTKNPDPRLEAYNALAAELREAIARKFDVPEPLTLRQNIPSHKEPKRG